MTSRYKIEQALLVDTDVTADDLTTITEAARILGITPQTLAQAMDAGRWTVVIDTLAPSRQGRRLLLRSEVEARTAEEPSHPAE